MRSADTSAVRTARRAGDRQHYKAAGRPGGGRTNIRALLRRACYRSGGNICVACHARFVTSCGPSVAAVCRATLRASRRGKSHVFAASTPPLGASMVRHRCVEGSTTTEAQVRRPALVFHRDSRVDDSAEFMKRHARMQKGKSAALSRGLGRRRPLVVPSWRLQSVDTSMRLRAFRGQPARLRSGHLRVGADRSRTAVVVRGLALVRDLRRSWTARCWRDRAPRRGVLTWWS